MSIQEDLRDAIDESEASLYRIAKDTEMDYSTLHRFYHGQTDARIVTADKLADYLGLRLQPIRKKGASR
jgi:hypothetical protein